MTTSDTHPATPPEAVDIVISHAWVLSHTEPAPARYPANSAGSRGTVTFLPDHSVGIRGNRIAWVRPSTHLADSPPQAHTTIDARGALLVPGFLNGHTHSPMTMFRGAAEDVRTEDWFNAHIWPMEVNLTRRDVRLGARIGIAEMLLAGVTSFADHYFDMDEVAEEVAEQGIRATLASTFFSSQGAAGRERSEEFAARWHGAAGGRITTALGPHATYTVNDQDLRATADSARRTGTRIHIHAAENMDQTLSSLSARGVTPIRVLYDTGVLDAGAIIAHGVGITQSDIPLLQEYADRVAIAACTKNYMKHAMGGGTPLRMLHDAGITVGVGTDGAASNNTLDVLESLRMLVLLNKNREEDATWVTMAHALDLLTRQSATLFGMSDSLGRIEPGFLADLVVIDLNRPHLQPVHDPGATLVLSARASDVSVVIVDGRVLVKDGRLVRDDVQDAFDELARRLPALTNRSHGLSIQEYAP